VRVAPAFERALSGLSDDYQRNAPQTVGIGQYPQGREIYAELVQAHTTLSLTPEEVHARGVARLAQIEEAIEAIQAEVGFAGDSVGFKASLDNDPRWRANNSEEITALFQRYIDRITPQIAEFFPVTPKASYGVAALPEALQKSMTFGYYDPPKKDRDRGIYFFNPANLTQRALPDVATLTYHELMPGHHLHFATQQENATLHPFRANSIVTSYVEGWAEYAAAFAGEIGMFQAPQERYGRLVMDAFLSTRLVVDTGMNTMGWSLEQARDYMRAHSRMPEAEVLSESLRYSCDIPGQALAYKLGDTQIFMLRERMRHALGERFNLKDLHNAVLGPGALPLQDLEWHVDREIERLKHKRAPRSPNHS